jgi:hypothetical protein
VWCLSVIWLPKIPAEGSFGGRRISALALPSPRRARER